MAILGLPEEEFFASGHRACPGCGAAIAIRLITKAAGRNSILVEPTGCIEVCSTPYPETSWKVPWIHGAFENSASIASGICAALKSKGKKANVVAIGGDGASYDIGLQFISGAFERGHDFTYVVYDNEAYMNTGIQRSSSTPYGASTTTSPAGRLSIGKGEWKKDLMHIFSAHNVRYLATASVGYPADAFRKLKKAIETDGPAFVNILCPCPTGWRFSSEKTIKIAKLAVETGVAPLYEIINGKHSINRPRDIDKLKPVEEYLKLQGRYKHLFKPVRKEKEIELIQGRIRENMKLLLEYSDKGF